MIAIGTAGCTIPRISAAYFTGEGTILARYGGALRCVEINSPSYRLHRFATYARWAASTPRGFRSAVRLPREITHDSALQGTRRPLDEFLEQVRRLGASLGVLPVQLPPSLPFAPRVASAFSRALRDRHGGIGSLSIRSRMDNGQNGFGIRVKAYGDVSRATLARMTTEVYFGNDVAYLTATWMRRPKGWSLRQNPY